MSESLNKLRALTSEISTLNGIMALLGWDEQCYLPKGSTQGRGEQMAYIGGLAHEKGTSPQLGEAIATLQAEIGDLDADTDIAREVKMAKRAYDQNTRIPKEKMIEFIIATTHAHAAWEVARQENTFPTFQPHLEKIVGILREFTEMMKPWDHPYDALLDMYEPGMKTKEVKAIFEALRPQQVELLKRIADSEQVDNGFIKQNFPRDGQAAIGSYVSKRFGYNFQQGRIDEAAHPFTTELAPDDVRFTTRFLDDDGFSALFSTMHETGHALYGQGMNPAWKKTSLGDAASLGFHESQSRLWENLVGRSREFWTWFYPMAQMQFPAQLGNVKLDDFYRGINRVEPSLVRVEADEATYNLHIMVRMEIEIALIEGKIEAKDLPEIWNTKMQDYLGVTPRTDSEGVLQDVHWSGGSIGYFPTYALGNLISVQLWNKMLSDQPAIPEEMRQGEFGSILSWLRENVHRWNNRYDPQELVRRITGEGINPQPYMEYLWKKYGEVYRF